MGYLFLPRYKCTSLVEATWETFLWLVVDAYVLRRQREIPFVARRSCMRFAEATWDTTGEYRGIPGDTAGCRGIPWDTAGYRGIPRATAGYRGMPRDVAGRAGLSTSQLLLDMCMYKGTDSCTTLPYVATGY